MKLIDEAIITVHVDNALVSFDDDIRYIGPLYHMHWAVVLNVKSSVELIRQQIREERIE